MRKETAHEQKLCRVPDDGSDCVRCILPAHYIKLQSDVTARMKAIARLESQITDLKADNDEAYKRINTTIDLDGIRNTAINELGMFYATEDQIVYYSVDRNDYMNQYTEIPQK